MYLHSLAFTFRANYRANKCMKIHYNEGRPGLTSDCTVLLFRLNSLAPSDHYAYSGVLSIQLQLSV